MKTHVKNEKQSENVATRKKPFDKKKYRMQKYSNKFKINQWEERRKKAVLRDFYKELDKDQQQNLKAQSASKKDSHEEKQIKKRSAFLKAKQEFLRKKDEKIKAKEQILKAKAEKKEALKKYKEKRLQTYKALSKKTKKGQPVMKDRIEMLLEKIQVSS